MQAFAAVSLQIADGGVGGCTGVGGVGGCTGGGVGGFTGVGLFCTGGCTGF